VFILNKLEPLRLWWFIVLLVIGTLWAGLTTPLLHLLLFGFFMFQVPFARSV
jgi:hypothetical protein